MESGFSFSDLQGIKELGLFEEAEINNGMAECEWKWEGPAALKTLTWNNECVMLAYDQPTIPASQRNTTNTKKHCVEERNRRQKLSHAFLTLSTLLPPLNKGDKISILGDAIAYIKQLEEKVKALEDQTNNTPMEVFRLHKYGGDDDNSSSESYTFPEIEARCCNKEVLISIHCPKRKGILGKIVAQIHDKFHLSVINSNVITFGDSAFNITLIAQRKDERIMNIEELVKDLCGILK